MTEKEAFEAWWEAKRYRIEIQMYNPTPKQRQQDVWQAACAYQRKKDAEICLTASPIKTAAQDVREACANAIENQT